MNAEIVARLAESFLGVIVTPDELEDVRSKQEEMAEALSKAADRERELLNRVMMLVDAMNKSNESHQRLIELLEAQNVGQKA